MPIHGTDKSTRDKRTADKSATKRESAQMSNRERDIIQSLARRAFLKKGSVGIGAAALAEMLVGETLAQSTFQQDLGILGATHHAPKAKRVIYLHMFGAISHVDTFDYCPMLEKMHGQQTPASIMGEGRLSTMVPSAPDPQ